MTNIEIFKQSVTVIDTETTSLIPEECEIVEVASAKWYTYHWATSDILLGTYKEIPPEASAKNNISRKMIENLPKFDQFVAHVKQILDWPDSKYWVAHNATYDRKALKTAFEKLGMVDDVELCNNSARWICTWRLSKQILSHDFNDTYYGLNYLRYKLDLDVPETIGVHRAGADAYTCAILLDKLIEIGILNGTINEKIPLGPQLSDLSWKFNPITTWPFGGKHKGKLLTELDNDYYLWALKTLSQLKEGDPTYDADLAESIRLVLEKRLSEA